MKDHLSSLPLTAIAALYVMNWPSGFKEMKRKRDVIPLDVELGLSKMPTTQVDGIVGGHLQTGTSVQRVTSRHTKDWWQ